jgi:hypothetical protein
VDEVIDPLFEASPAFLNADIKMAPPQSFAGMILCG